MQWVAFKDWSEACLKSTLCPEGSVDMVGSQGLEFSPDSATIATGYGGLQPVEEKPKTPRLDIDGNPIEEEEEGARS